jgi:hypothetical protein
VGTPKGRLTKLEAQLAEQSWRQVRPAVSVKLLGQDQETFVYVESRDRVAKERSIRRRKLKALWARLQELQGMKLKRDELLVKLGQAKQKAGRAYGLVEIQVPDQVAEGVLGAGLQFELRKDRLRQVRRREGRYLLRSNLTDEDPGQLWQMYLRLVEIEEAFRDLKSDLRIRPVWHWRESRVEAHIFVAFLAYCLHVCLKGHLRKVAGGLTPRAVLGKFAAMQLVDVHLPLETGEVLVLRRRTQPDKDQRLLLTRLGWELPAQSPPRITSDGKLEPPL